MKPWEYTKDVHTDQPMENLIVDSVRAVLLDYLPNEIPYNLGVEMEYLDKNEGLLGENRLVFDHFE